GLPRTLEVTVERRELLGQEVLLRPRYDEHCDLYGHLVADQRHRPDLVVLLLEERPRRREAPVPVGVDEIALAVPHHPADDLPLLPRHLEKRGEQHLLSWVREHPASSIALDDERAVRVDAVLACQGGAA